MKDITITNEIGKVIVDSGLDKYVSTMISNWEASIKTPSWFNKASFVSVVNFLLVALDDVILYVESLPASGPDKKATVINTVAKLYDNVIVAAMPIWLKPFSSMIRSIVIGEMLPATVDFIVDKYNSSSWAVQTPTATPTVTAQMFGEPGDPFLPN
jgi:hypothetical protein